MHNPLRSEADVFRLVIAIVLGVALLVAVTLLTRPVVGVILAAALIGFGIGLAYRGARGGLPRHVGVTSNGDATHRLLVVANRTVTGRPLLEEIGKRAGGRDSEILVVTPALVSSRAAHWASDLDEGIELARQRMDQSLAALAAAGLNARGEVGDSDPNMAIEDALRHFAADEILISTLPPEQSRWLEHGVVVRTRREVDVPVTHVFVDVGDERAPAQPWSTTKRSSVSS
jgi:GABA permease